MPEPDHNPISCRSCWHYTRGGYCAIRHENVEPDDGCSSWQSKDGKEDTIKALLARLKRQVDK
jgi:hypothetical protein